MQFLFPKHVWRHTECMPTSHWRTGASHIFLRVIAVAWWISSKQITNPLPTSLSYCCYLFCSAVVTTVVAVTCYCCYLLLLLLATVATCYCCHYCCSLLLLLLVTLLPLLATLLLLLCLQILIFQVWLNLTNSAANTWEYSLTSRRANQQISV